MIQCIRFIFMAILTSCFIVGLIRAEECPEYYAKLYHDTIDPPVIYVWNETTKTVQAASIAITEKAQKTTQWIYDHRDTIHDTIIITIGYTVQEARSFWEAYGDTIGNTIVIIADEAVDVAQDAYIYTQEIVGHLVLFYAQHQEQIEEQVSKALKTVAPFVKTAVIYVVETSANTARKAADLALKGEAYFIEHQDEIMEDIKRAYVWTHEKIVDISEMAKNTWIPSGLGMLGKAAEYYDKNVRPGLEDKARDIVTAAQDAAGRLVREGSVFIENNKNKAIGFAIYLQETGGNIWNYVSAEAGSKLQPKFQPKGGETILLNQILSSRQLAGKAWNGLKGNTEGIKNRANSIKASAAGAAKSAGQAVGNAIRSGSKSISGGKK